MPTGARSRGRRCLPPSVHAGVFRIREQLDEPVARRAGVERPVLRDYAGVEIIVESATATPPNSVVTNKVELPLHPSPMWQAIIGCLSESGINIGKCTLTILP